MGVTATVDGLAPFAASTADVAVRLADLDQVNADAAAEIVQAVEAPRITGTLAATVHAVVTPDGFEVAAGGDRAPYAAKVHARNPFLTRALDTHVDDVADAHEQHVIDSVATIQGA